MDAKAQFKSLAAEFSAVKNRVQNLIGTKHWSTVGSWKESVLRSVLRRHLPPSLQIGTGFVITKAGQSTQIDVLIYDNTGPVLFRDGDLAIVTPDVVRAVIEVKTNIRRNELRGVLTKVDKVASLLRRYPSNPAPFLGVFSYDDRELNREYLMDELANVNGAFGKYRVNCIAIGRRQFVRFWEFRPRGDRQAYNSWHCYDLNEIAQAYFVHNVIEHLHPRSVVLNDDLWYPVDGKESRLVCVRPTRQAPNRRQ